MMDRGVCMQKLIAMGATDIVVPGVLPIGCFPIYLTVYGTSNAADYDGLGCLKKFNDLSANHNSLLQAQIRSLQAKHKSARIIYADFYSGVYDMVKSPANYGTYVVTRSCHENGPAAGRQAKPDQPSCSRARCRIFDRTTRLGHARWSRTRPKVQKRERERAYI
jgi:phospholipase/lecithinase/hemolysin